MNRKGIKKIALAASIGLIAIIGTTAAFLTSNDSADNQFTIGKVALDIQEDFDKDRKLAAGEIITKQPKVRNTGTVNELFFVEVSVPCMNAAFLTDDGQRITPEGVTLSDPPKAEEFLQTEQIFNLLANGSPAKGNIISPVTDANGVKRNWELSYNAPSAESPGWVYVKQTESQKSYQNVQGMRDGIYDTYVLGYSVWVEPDKDTIPVFDKLQLRSIIDGDVKGGTVGQVQVNAYTIQADDLGIESLNGNGSVHSQYDQTDLTKIYRIIENKNETT